MKCFIARMAVIMETGYRRMMKKFIKSTALILLFVFAWYIGSALSLWSAYVLPSPRRVGISLADMLQKGIIVKHVGASLGRVLTGFGIAFALALILGVIAGVRSRTFVYYRVIVEFLRNVPPLSLIPLLILWFGIGETSKIIIIVLASFFPMFLNIKKGLASCDARLLEVGDSLNFSMGKKFIRIMLPNALPDILVGMRIGLGYSWRAIIGAEMIAAASGLGYMILDAQQMSRSDKVIVGIVVIGLVGLACDWLFSFAIRKIVHGGLDDSWS